MGTYLMICFRSTWQQIILKRYLIIRYLIMPPITKTSYTKVKTEHTVMKEFHDFLIQIEKIEEIIRIIPGRIHREQSGRSWFRISFSYPTISGLKYKMCKWSTGQELFVVCKKWSEEKVIESIKDIIWSKLISY